MEEAIVVFSPDAGAGHGLKSALEHSRTGAPVGHDSEKSMRLQPNLFANWLSQLEQPSYSFSFGPKTKHPTDYACANRPIISL